MRVLKRCAAAILIASVLGFLYGTWRWPLTRDSALMHYICFLMQHGHAPYRDIFDINLPGSYLPNWWLQWAFGPSALAWRLYDVTLLAIVGLSFYTIVRPYSRFAALWAACLFAVIHGRDGMENAGERDLFAAALMVAGLAALLSAKRSGRDWPALLFGVAAGVAITVKPTTLAFLALPLVDLLTGITSREKAKRRLRLALCGWLLPLLFCTFWLIHHGSLHAFLYNAMVLARYHASSGHASWHFLLYDSVSPLMPLVTTFAVLLVWRKYGQALTSSVLDDRNVRLILWSAVLCGFLSYLAQRRAYPYHRYPFLIFLLLLIAIELEASLKSRDFRLWLSIAAIAWSSFLLAPVSAWKAAGYQGATGALEAQLVNDIRLTGEEHGVSSLNGQVQCLDSVSGCIGALEHLQVEQTSGHLYDEFLFHAADDPAVRHMRQSFAQQMLSHPPVIFVITDPLFPSGPDHYGKLAQWPEFSQWLNENYTIALTRAPSTSIRVMGRRVVPVGYRLYVRR